MTFFRPKLGRLNIEFTLKYAIEFPIFIFNVELYEMTDFRKKDAGFLTRLYFSKKLALKMTFLDGQFCNFFLILTGHLLWSLSKLMPRSAEKFEIQKVFNPLSANPTKWSNILKQFFGNLPSNCLSVFDHLWGWGLKG